MPILEVKDMYKSFGNTHVLKGVSFSIEKGDVVSVIGASGNGKTTLLRCLTFLERAEKGKIIVDGETVYDAEIADKLTERQIRQSRLRFGLVSRTSTCSLSIPHCRT